MQSKKKHCECCGTCCRNGGPPLHTQDLELISSGILTLSNLVTIRRGELVFPPMATSPVTAETEWIKLQGIEGEWCCQFLHATSNTCTIYDNRPVSCQALKCWDTKEILSLAGKDLLCRIDLIKENDPLLTRLELQEDQCPVPDLEDIASLLEIKEERDQVLMELNTLVQKDLQIRSMAVRDFNISVALELFYFGRPLFQILQPLGLAVIETPHGISLHFSSH